MEGKEYSYMYKKNVQKFDFKLVLTENLDHLNTNSASWAGTRKTRQHAHDPFYFIQFIQNIKFLMFDKSQVYQNVKAGHS
jgi:hypothetical protein